MVQTNSDGPTHARTDAHTYTNCHCDNYVSLNTGRLTIKNVLVTLMCRLQYMYFANYLNPPKSTKHQGLIENQDS